jgi:zinc D-Ala-D-Ala carboxypeptidase
MPRSNRGHRNARARVPFPVVAAILLVVAVAVVAFRARLSSPSGQPGSGSESSGGRTSPGSGTSPSPSVRLQALPSCRYGSELTARVVYSDWRVTFLDTNFGLPRSYAPPGLVSTARAGFGAGYVIRKIVVKDLAALRAAAETAGSPIGIVAAYRSYAQQVKLFDARRAELGYRKALLKTARPGHSEHQMGTTLDFKTRGAPDVDKAWASTPAGRWVGENAWRFGFVESYPRAKRSVTCYGYEPWHYRYVGRALAARIHDSGLTLREFLWRWNQEHSS